jgi:hypothetical protein
MIPADSCDGLDFSDPDDIADLGNLDPSCANALDSLMFFIGRNVVAGKEKVYAVQKLRGVILSRTPPSPATIEAFALRAGKREKVARQLRALYEGLVAGKRFRDTSGRTI